MHRQPIMRKGAMTFSFLLSVVFFWSSAARPVMAIGLNVDLVTAVPVVTEPLIEPVQELVTALPAAEIEIPQPPSADVLPEATATVIEDALPPAPVEIPSELPTEVPPVTETPDAEGPPAEEVPAEPEPIPEPAPEPDPVPAEEPQVEEPTLDEPLIEEIPEYPYVDEPEGEIHRETLLSDATASEPEVSAASPMVAGATDVDAAAFAPDSGPAGAWAPIAAVAAVAAAIAAAAQRARKTHQAQREAAEAPCAACAGSVMTEACPGCQGAGAGCLLCTGSGVIAQGFNVAKQCQSCAGQAA